MHAAGARYASPAVLGGRAVSDESIYQQEDAGKLVGEVFSGKLGVRDALTKLRMRLLDLTMRNRLLNFKPSKARSCRHL
jgi:hypothetical protein